MPVEISLTRGHYVALADDADAELVRQHRWSLDLRSDGRRYAIARAGNSTIRMHRLLMSAPAGSHIDHQDGDGLNNCRSNLRTATASQNTFNQRRIRSWPHNKHGFRGVSYIVKDGDYRGRLQLDGTQHYTKAFATPIEAAIAWDELALKHYGEFATLNFPDLRAAA